MVNNVNKNHPDAILEVLWRSLSKNMDLLETDRVSEMENLEEMTKTLCESIAALPTQQAIAYEPKLKELIEHLTVVSDKLTHKQQTVMQEINVLNKKGSSIESAKRPQRPTFPTDKKKP